MRKRTEVGEFLIKIRSMNKQTRADMLETLGISAATLSNIEWGHRDITKNIRNEIIKKYKLTPYEIDDLDRAILYSSHNVKLDMNKFTTVEKNKLYKMIRGRIFE